jgi:hypothetical protein
MACLIGAAVLLVLTFSVYAHLWCSSGPVTSAPARQDVEAFLRDHRERGAAVFQRYDGQLLELEGACASVGKNEHGSFILLAAPTATMTR